MCLFIIILQTKPGLDKNGEKVEAQCFCKDCNLCLCTIFTDKPGLEDKGGVEGKCFCKNCNQCLVY